MGNGQISRWVGLVAGIWVQCLAGNGNVFPNFAPALKSQLHLSQVQLNNLGVAKDFGENVGLLAGLLSNLLPPWVILVIGALEALIGYGTVWLVMSGRIPQLAYWQMCILMIIGANSCTCFNTAVLVTSMRNFPHSRGPVVGFVKGFFGLSSAIYTQIFVAIFLNNATDLLLFLAVGPFVVCLVAMYFIQPVPSPGEKKPNEQTGFQFILVLCIALAVYLFAATLMETFVEDISPLMYKILIAGMLVFLISPLVVPAKFAFDEYLIFREKRASIAITASSTPQTSLKIDDDLREPLLKAEEQDQKRDLSTNATLHTEEDAEVQRPKPSGDLNESAQDPGKEQTDGGSPQGSDQHSSQKSAKFKSSEKGDFGCLSVPRSEDGLDAETLLAVGEGAVRRRKGPRRGQDFTLMQALVKADFWLLFFTYLCGVGTAITAVNNLGQMGQAQGYNDVTIFVSLVSIMNFLARLGGGSLSEYYVKSAALPRTVVLVGAQVLLILGYLLFALAIPGSLYVGSVILGISYGIHVAVMVPTASELFGLRHFGVIYNFINMAILIGSLVFSGGLAGYLYDKESETKTASLHVIAAHITTRYYRVSLDSDDEACLGAHCFELTFFIMALVSLIGLGLNIVLTRRIRRVYRSLYASSSTHSSYQNLAAEGQRQPATTPSGSEKTTNVQEASHRSHQSPRSSS